MSRLSASRSDELQRRYSIVLKEYLAETAGTTLQSAEALGRQAVAAGVGASALATLHKHALMTLVSPNASSRTTNGKIARASSYLAAALKPMDNADGAKKAKGAKDDSLTRLQDTMHRIKRELAGTQRQLTLEMTRCTELETALRASRQRHAQLMKSSLRARGAALPTPSPDPLD